MTTPEDQDFFLASLSEIEGNPDKALGFARVEHCRTDRLAPSLTTEERLENLERQALQLIDHYSGFVNEVRMRLEAIEEEVGLGCCRDDGTQLFPRARQWKCDGYQSAFNILTRLAALETSITPASENEASTVSE